MYDVITIGSATRDVFLESNDFRDIKSREFSSGMGECLALGSKNEVQRIFFTTGGGATNAAVTFARLGLKVACLTRVGHDDAGAEIIKVLRRAGVDTRFIQKDAHDNTAYSTLLMHGPGERTILVYRGVSVKLSFDPHLFPPPTSRGRTKEGVASWFYVTSLGGNLSLIKKIWSFARANKIKIAWNPGGEELKLGWTKLLPFIKQCEVFNINREEANQLLEARLRVAPAAKVSPRQIRFGLGSVKMTQVSLRQILDGVCNLAKITLITDGARGAYCCLTPTFSSPSLRGRIKEGDQSQFLHVSSLGTKARNTTGAGDAFGSGFVVGLILFETEPRRTKKTLSFGLSRLAGRQKISVEKIESALRLAILNADSVIRQMGAKTGILKKMPSKKEFNKVKITSYKL